MHPLGLHARRTAHIVPLGPGDAAREQLRLQLGNECLVFAVGGSHHTKLLRE